MTFEPLGQGPGAGRAVLALLLACATLTVMAGATIGPSLPGLLAHFRDVPDAGTLVPLILTAPGLAIALAAPLCGWLVDRTDPRRVLILSILLYVAAGSSGLWLDGLMPILAGRILLGLAVGGVMTSSTTLISVLFSGPERGRVLGYQASAMGFGGVLFILGGGLLADLSWRGPFAMYLAPLALLPLVLAALPDIADRRRAVPGAPAARFPLGLALPIYAGAFASFLVFYMIPTQLPFLFEALGASRASTAGYAIALVALVSASVSLGYGRVRERFGPATIGGLSFAVLGAGYAAVAAAEGFAAIFLAAPVIGAALGLIMPNHMTWLMSAVPPAMRGRASGFMTMSIFLAQFMSAFVGAWLVGAGGLGAAFWGTGLLSAGVAVVYLWAAVRLREGLARGA